MIMLPDASPTDEDGEAAAPTDAGWPQSSPSPEPALSIVIPAYQEQNRIARSLERILAHLHGTDYEVVVVDDGSTDRTVEVVQAFQRRDPRVRLLQEPHRGKGAAVRAGMLGARGRCRYLADADLSTPITEVGRFLRHIEDGADVVIGSREAAGAERHGEPLRRHFMGRCFNRLVQALLLPGIEDTQCGFKCFRGEVAHSLFSRQTLDGFAFDVEVLALARASRHRIDEIGVPWYYDADSKVRPVTDAWKMARGIAQVRRNLRGATPRPSAPDRTSSPPRRRRLLRAACVGAGLLVTAVLLYQFLFPPWYAVPPARPFAGSRWYNPYAGFSGSGLRCSLHAHTLAWNGLTYGECPPDRFHELHDELGYDVAVVTNYQHIEPRGADQSVWIPAYEHCANLGNQHQNVFGAERVEWLDYPLPQGFRQKQHVLERLQGSGTVIFINHPEKGAGYTEEDFAGLQGFDGLEVATKYTKNGRRFWDAALSAGRPVWGVATDDGHRQLSRESHLGIGWVVVEAEARRDAVLESLKQGRFHAVWDYEKVGPNQLRSCRFEAGKVKVAVARPADEIRFIGQGGRPLRTVRKAKKAAYATTPEDTYVRVEVATRGSTLFLNPVYRFESDPLEGRRRPERRATLTWLSRGLGLGLLLLATSGAWTFIRRPLVSAARSGTPARPLDDPAATAAGSRA